MEPENDPKPKATTSTIGDAKAGPSSKEGEKDIGSTGAILDTNNNSPTKRKMPPRRAKSGNSISKSNDELDPTSAIDDDRQDITDDDGSGDNYQATKNDEMDSSDEEEDENGHQNTKKRKKKQEPVTKAEKLKKVDNPDGTVARVPVLTALSDAEARREKRKAKLVNVKKEDKWVLKKIKMDGVKVQIFGLYEAKMNPITNKPVTYGSYKQLQIWCRFCPVRIRDAHKYHQHLMSHLKFIVKWIFRTRSPVFRNQYGTMTVTKKSGAPDVIKDNYRCPVYGEIRPVGKPTCQQFWQEHNEKEFNQHLLFHHGVVWDFFEPENLAPRVKETQHIDLNFKLKRGYFGPPPIDDLSKTFLIEHTTLSNPRTGKRIEEPIRNSRKQLVSATEPSLFDYCDLIGQEYKDPSQDKGCVKYKNLEKMWNIAVTTFDSGFVNPRTGYFVSSHHLGRTEKFENFRYRNMYAEFEALELSIHNHMPDDGSQKSQDAMIKAERDVRTRITLEKIEVEKDKDLYLKRCQELETEINKLRSLLSEASKKREEFETVNEALSAQLKTRDDTIADLRRKLLKLKCNFCGKSLNCDCQQESSTIESITVENNELEDDVNQVGSIDDQGNLFNDPNLIDVTINKCYTCGRNDAMENGECTGCGVPAPNYGMEEPAEVTPIAIVQPNNNRAGVLETVAIATAAATAEATGSAAQHPGSGDPLAILETDDRRDIANAAMTFLRSHGNNTAADQMEITYLVSAFENVNSTTNDVIIALRNGNFTEACNKLEMIQALMMGRLITTFINQLAKMIAEHQQGMIKVNNQETRMNNQDTRMNEMIENHNNITQRINELDVDDRVAKLQAIDAEVTRLDGSCRDINNTLKNAGGETVKKVKEELGNLQEEAGNVRKEAITKITTFKNNLVKETKDAEKATKAANGAATAANDAAEKAVRVKNALNTTTDTSRTVLEQANDANTGLLEAVDKAKKDVQKEGESERKKVRAEGNNYMKNANTIETLAGEITKNLKKAKVIKEDAEAQKSQAPVKQKSTDDNDYPRERRNRGRSTSRSSNRSRPGSSRGDRDRSPGSFRRSSKNDDDNSRSRKSRRRSRSRSSGSRPGSSRGERDRSRTRKRSPYSRKLDRKDSKSDFTKCICGSFYDERGRHDSGCPEFEEQGNVQKRTGNYKSSYKKQSDDTYPAQQCGSRPSTSRQNQNYFVDERERANLPRFDQEEDHKEVIAESSSEEEDDE